MSRIQKLIKGEESETVEKKPVSFIKAGILILLLLSSVGSAEVKVKSHISRIDYEVNPGSYVNRGEEVTITVTVMGKRMDDVEWKPITGTVEIESDPGNSAIPDSVPGGGTISFTPESDTWLTLKFKGDSTYQASEEKKILIGVLYFSSPLMSSEFIMLFILLIVALLSYRLFSRGKLDINSLWREIRGEGT